MPSIKCGKIASEQTDMNAYLILSKTQKKEVQEFIDKLKDKKFFEDINKIEHSTLSKNGKTYISDEKLGYRIDQQGSGVNKINLQIQKNGPKKNGESSTVSCIVIYTPPNNLITYLYNPADLYKGIEDSLYDTKHQYFGPTN